MRSLFQAEDGIRDLIVTGVQTCALPISRGADGTAPHGRSPATRAGIGGDPRGAGAGAAHRGRARPPGEPYRGRVPGRRAARPIGGAPRGAAPPPPSPRPGAPPPPPPPPSRAASAPPPSCPLPSASRPP